MKDELTDRDIDHYEKTGEYPAGWSALAFRFEITKLARLGRGGQALPPEGRDTVDAERYRWLIRLAKENHDGAGWTLHTTIWGAPSLEEIGPCLDIARGYRPQDDSRKEKK